MKAHPGLGEVEGLRAKASVLRGSGEGPALGSAVFRSRGGARGQVLSLGRRWLRSDCATRLEAREVLPPDADESGV